MWNKNLPRNHFFKADYPNLEDGAEGQVKPLSWGTIKNFVPVCTDIVALNYMFNDGDVEAIDKVVADNIELEASVSYTDLGGGEISLGGTPLLSADTDYFIVLESDYAVSAVNYLNFGQSSYGGGYAAGEQWYMDGSGVWTEQSATGKDLIFSIRGSSSLEGKTNLWLQYPSADALSWSPWNAKFKLRDDAARTKIAQRFHTKTTGGPWYIRKCTVYVRKTGTPVSTRTTRLSFMTSVGGEPGVQVGVKSDRMETDLKTRNIAKFPQRGAPSDVRIDFQGRKYATPPGAAVFVNTVGKIVPDIYVNVLKGTLSDLGDLTDLEAFPQTLAVSAEEEVSFGSMMDKFEAGQQFKMVPTADGGFTFKAFAALPDTGLELFDEDMHEFRCIRRISGHVFGKVRVGYNVNLATSEYKFAEAVSEVAELVYRNEETLLVETFLDVASDAQALAEARKLQVQTPAFLISFKLGGGKGTNLLPGDKIKVYREHADYTGGSLSGVLFRIVSITPAFSDDTCEVMAQLDTQTY